jgi:hypothetical protein
MGYYTDYQISILSSPERTENVLFFLNEITENYFKINEQNVIFTEEPIKWYDYQKAMLLCSKRFPDLVLLVEGLGEEPMDIWRHYFQDGKHWLTKAQIIFEDFSPDKLTQANTTSQSQLA